MGNYSAQNRRIMRCGMAGNIPAVPKCGTIQYCILYRTVKGERCGTVQRTAMRDTAYAKAQYNIYVEM
jgi:hypothetical protein